METPFYNTKIKNILNIINSEICTFDNWNFLLRKKILKLPKGATEILNTVNGKINTLSIDGQKYVYTQDFEAFVLNKTPKGVYSVLNDMLLLPKFNEDKKLDIIYYTNDFVKSADGTEKMRLEKEDDISQIPDPFAEPLLVYGTCMRMKANPSYSKFSYWLGMYKDNIANMRSKLCTDIQQSPSITLERF